ncbi:MAG: hypothetical protein HC907_31090 [Richelia sp. SM1_7_0]|nr:hypothetical protein [Richelia sp. SM1_7_0]
MGLRPAATIISRQTMRKRNSVMQGVLSREVQGRFRFDQAPLGRGWGLGVGGWGGMKPEQSVGYKPCPIWAIVLGGDVSPGATPYSLSPITHPPTPSS